MPRRQDPVWRAFNRVKKDNNSGPWAVCTKCHRQMQGIVERLHKHYAECYDSKVDSNSDADAEAGATTSHSSNQADSLNTASSLKTETDELLLNKDNSTEDNSTVKSKQEFDRRARKRRTRPSVGSVTSVDLNSLQLMTYRLSI